MSFFHPSRAPSERFSIKHKQVETYSKTLITAFKLQNVIVFICNAWENKAIGIWICEYEGFQCFQPLTFDRKHFSRGSIISETEQSSTQLANLPWSMISSWAAGSIANLNSKIEEWKATKKRSFSFFGSVYISNRQQQLQAKSISTHDLSPSRDSTCIAQLVFFFFFSSLSVELIPPYQLWEQN